MFRIAIIPMRALKYLLKTMCFPVLMLFAVVVAHRMGRQPNLVGVAVQT